jgi:hypothetical protein
MMPFVNTAVVVGVVGPSTLREVYTAASPGELGSIIAFSILWGFGGVGFGQAIKRIGVALGTSVVMGREGLHDFFVLAYNRSLVVLAYLRILA